MTLLKLIKWRGKLIASGGFWMKTEGATEISKEIGVENQEGIRDH